MDYERIDYERGETIYRIGVLLFGELLRNEAIRLRGLWFDKTRSVVTIPMSRQFHKGPARSVRKVLLSTTTVQDWIATLLTIESVQSCDLEDLEEKNVYYLSECKYSDGVVRVQFGKRTTLTMEIDNFKYYFTDIGACGNAYTRRFPFGFHISWAEATLPDLAGCRRSNTFFYLLSQPKPAKKAG